MTTPLIETAAPAVGPAPSALEVINDRYAVERCLGQGGMGAVYLVRDLARSEHRVALKRVRRDRIDSNTVRTLRNEFVAMSCLKHPNVPAAYDFGTDAASGDLFFTTEFVDGIDWKETTDALNLTRSEDFQSFLRILLQVLRGLAFVHSRDVVHGDIKPENILVTGDPRRPERDPAIAKLIDFGLAKRAKSYGGKKIIGTPYYVAPETILGSTTDQRTDLYSLGIVLYQLVTGRAPFVGGSNLEILKSHVEVPPIPPIEIAPHLPLDLSRGILRLIEKTPEKRFQNALEFFQFVISSFGIDEPLETESTLSSYLDTVWITGRTRALDDMKQVFSCTVQPERVQGGVSDEQTLETIVAPDEDDVGEQSVGLPLGRFLLLRGERGSGKRFLVDRLRMHVQTCGIPFLRFSCSEKPHSDEAALGRIVSDVSRLVWPSLRARLSTFYRGGKHFEVAAPDRGGKWSRGVQRAILDIVRGLVEVSRDLPLVICFSRLELAGATFTRFVETLVATQASEQIQGGRLFVVGSLGEREGVERGPFERLSNKRRLKAQVFEVVLRRHDESTVGRLLRQAFPGGRFPSVFARRLYEESDGNIVAVQEILSFLLRRGLLSRVPSGWVLDPEFESVELPGKIRRELQERLSRLSTDALHLAIALSCMQHVCVPEVAGQVAGLRAASIDGLKKTLLREGVLREAAGRTAEEELGFVHETAKSMLYGRIQPEKRAALHRRLGALLEEHFLAQGRVHHKELARHFLLCEQREKGMTYGLEAARAYASEFAVSEAIETYARVLDVAKGRQDLETQVRREMARLYLHVGDYAGVLQLSRTAGGEATERELDLHALRARTRLGRFADADAILAARTRRSETEAIVGDESEFEAERAWLELARGRNVTSLRACRAAFSGDMIEGDATRRAELELVAAENYDRLGDRDSSAASCQRAVRLLDAQRDDQLLAESLFCRGRYYRYRGNLRQALKQFQLSLLLRREQRAYDAQADCLLELARVEAELDCPQRARPHVEKALAVYERTGNLRGRVAALSLLGEVERWLGDYEASRHTIDRLLDACRRLGDLEYIEAAYSTLGAASADRGDTGTAERYVRKAQRALRRRRPLSAARSWSVYLQGEWSYQQGYFDRALEKCNQALRNALTSKQPRLVGAVLLLRGQIFDALDDQGEVRRNLTWLVDVATRNGLRVVEGRARMLEGALFAKKGQVDAAARTFETATNLFSDEGSERDLAWLYLEYGLFALRNRDEEQAFLNLTEGAFLAKKLDLAYLRCRFQVARGLFEAALEESENAERSLRVATKMAKRFGYRPLELRSHMFLRALLRNWGRLEEAEVEQASCGRLLEELRVDVPRRYRERFSGDGGRRELRQG